MGSYVHIVYVVLSTAHVYTYWLLYYAEVFAILSFSLVIIIITIIITFVIFISFDTDECHADSAKANSMCMYHVLLYGQ